MNNYIVMHKKECELYGRRVTYGGSEPCKGSFSGTYVEHLYWKGKVTTDVKYQTLGPSTIKIKPPPNVQSAYDCKEGCLVACQGQHIDPMPQTPEVDCSGLEK